MKWNSVWIADQYSEPVLSSLNSQSFPALPYNKITSPHDSKKSRTLCIHIMSDEYPFRDNRKPPSPLDPEHLSPDSDHVSKRIIVHLNVPPPPPPPAGLRLYILQRTAHTRLAVLKWNLSRGECMWGVKFNYQLV